MARAEKIMAGDLLHPETDTVPCIKHKADPLDPCYGVYTYKLTKAEIYSLLNGKVLYADDSLEYAIVIYYAEDSDETL